MCLSQFARTDRLDVLGDLLLGWDCWTTRVVSDELRHGGAQYPELDAISDLDWLAITPFDTDEEILALLKWSSLVGAGDRDQGEASVFALAELRSGVALTDDRRAKQVAREHGIEVHGTVWLLAMACRGGKLTEVNAGSLIDGFLSLEARLPCTGAGFSRYARSHGLL
ncbi:Predicted nucleic acid-binding protein, contains PIN domain [Micromonospora pallida]|uniref:Predicted nucleic acid-binding protein, contains PIN domain n=2 Tax=Micromonospora pallida TaxID=145854 RepID=A0A1C6RQ99_9ACTN|nr:Predicted nucleic acid-binding protein, contains PIN domain [Micromonospora pallida]